MRHLGTEWEDRTPTKVSSVGCGQIYRASMRKPAKTRATEGVTILEGTGTIRVRGLRAQLGPDPAGLAAPFTKGDSGLSGE